MSRVFLKHRFENSHSIKFAFTALVGHWKEAPRKQMSWCRNYQKNLEGQRIKKNGENDFTNARNFGNLYAVGKMDDI